MLHSQAEMMELKASQSRDAEAVVVEARMDKGQGPVATVRPEAQLEHTLAQHSF